ncbi:MAG: cyclic nucleotide-binding domain-containing protein, partial [Trichodesmium sp. St7_bin2_1]|nr:cyclic nucleotide-binding domain-containing protein [Trichodesmium sp. St7_bin2_1]
MEDNANYKKAVDILSTISILKESFSINEIELFVKRANFQRYEKKVKIISKHEPAISIICLIAGEASVISNDRQLRILKGGDIFGESMFSEEGIRTADVIASTDVSVVIFTVEDYEKLTKISPSIARKYKLFFEAIYEYYKKQDDKFFYVDSTKYLALIAHNE